MEFSKPHSGNMQVGDRYAPARLRMIDEIRATEAEASEYVLKALSEKVLGIMSRVPRYRFVPLTGG
jgi:hypothetical protein